MYRRGRTAFSRDSGDVAPGTPHPVCRARLLLAGPWRPLAASSWAAPQTHSLRVWVEPYSFPRASRGHSGACAPSGRALPAREPPGRLGTRGADWCVPKSAELANPRPRPDPGSACLRDRLVGIQTPVTAHWAWAQRAGPSPSPDWSLGPACPGGRSEAAWCWLHGAAEAPGGRGGQGPS